MQLLQMMLRILSKTFLACRLAHRLQRRVEADLPTVLVVEDDVPLRTALIAALVSQGYVAREAGDVAGALDQIAADSVDVVLSDIGMPGNGYNLLAKVREMHPGTPV